MISPLAALCRRLQGNTDRPYARRAVCRSHITRRPEMIPSLQMRHASPGASICTRPSILTILPLLSGVMLDAHVDYRDEILICKLIDEMPAAVRIGATEDKITICDQLSGRSRQHIALDSLDMYAGGNPPHHTTRDIDLRLTNVGGLRADNPVQVGFRKPVGDQLAKRSSRRGAQVPAPRSNLSLRSR